MNKYVSYISQLLVKALNVIMIVAVMSSFIWNRYSEVINRSKNPVNTLVLLLVVYFGVYIYCIKIYSGFLILISRISTLIYSQTLSVLIADTVLYLLMIMLNGLLLNPIPMLEAVLIQFCVICLWSVLAHKWYFRHFSGLRTIFIYGRENCFEPFRHEFGFRKKFQIEAAMSIESYREMKDDPNFWDGIQTALISDLPLEDRDELLLKCYEKGIGIYYLPSVGDVLLGSAVAIDVCHHPILRIFLYKTPSYLLAKRLCDVLLSSIALILVSPVMLVTAAAIHLYDKGPVFYRQKRLTQNGKVFEILKFRSMKVDAEKDSGARLSSGSADDRITPVGRFIRMVRIDELPQLVNIIMGDMSIVGPRPERPELVEEYQKELPDFNLRLRMKAGLTGYAQVYGQYNTTPQEKLLMDLIYITKSSMKMDWELMMATVKILFMPESTEGVAAGQKTAMKK